MSYYGGGSTVGGGGYRFTAPSARKRGGRGGGGQPAVGLKRGSGGDESFSGISPVLSGTSGVPVSVQIVMKSSLPKLQRVSSLLESTRAKAIRMVKGTDSQRQFNNTFSELASVLSSVVADVEAELDDASQDPRNLRIFFPGGQPTNNKRPQKVAVTPHTLLKDVAKYIANQREVTIGLPYLETLANTALKSAIQRDQQEVSVSAKAVGVKQRVPSPTLAGNSPQQECDPLAKGVPPFALPTRARTTPTQPKKPQSVQEMAHLRTILQPWEIPYPFTSGYQPERVMSMKPSSFRQQQVEVVIGVIKHHHPKVYAEVAASLSSQKEGAKDKATWKLEVLKALLINSKGERRFTEERLYQMAPKVLDVCCGPAASDVARKWEAREALFNVLLDPETTIFKVFELEETRAPRTERKAPAVVVPLSTRDPFAGSPTLRPKQSPLMSPAMGPQSTALGDLPGLPALDMGVTTRESIGGKRDRDPTPDSDHARVARPMGTFFPHKARQSLIEDALAKAVVTTSSTSNVVPDGLPTFTDEEMLLLATPVGGPVARKSGQEISSFLSSLPRAVLQVQADAGNQPATTVSARVMTSLVHFGVVTTEMPLQQT